MKSPQTILIIDDESSLRAALKDQLGREGFKTLEAADGVAALALALREHPDLLLLDILMPKMDGLTLLAKLREDSWGKHAKVILLTNVDDNKKLAEALMEGVHQYLVKADWPIERVVEKVRERLSEEIT